MWILSLNKNKTHMETAVVVINVNNSGYFYKIPLKHLNLTTFTINNLNQQNYINNRNNKNNNMEVSGGIIFYLTAQLG